MTVRVHNAEKYNALKMASRQLHKSAGGLESAASLTRVQHAQLGVYQNINIPDQFAPIDVIADLEHETNSPIVTKALCALNGGYFTPFPATAGHTSLPVNIARIGKEFAEVMAESALALEDGIITPQEKIRLFREIDEAIQALAHMKSSLEGQG